MYKFYKVGPLQMTAEKWLKNVGRDYSVDKVALILDVLLHTYILIYSAKDNVIRVEVCYMHCIHVQ